MLATNRTKAVIAANIYHFFGTANVAVMKHVSNRHGVNVLDIRLVTNVVVLLSSLCVLKTQGISMRVP